MRFTKTERYAFDHRWKLYEDGRLFDWAADPGEKKPVENAAARARLGAVIARYRRMERELRTP